MLHSNLSVNSAGHLVTGQSDVVELAMKYGTPLYILDEDRVRENCRKYKDAMSKYAAPGSAPLYAGKALCYAGIYKTMMQEGFSADVVSAGELYTAMRVGFPTEKLYFHGNSKPDNEIEYAIDVGVGHFVVDSVEELEKIDQYAGRKKVKQKVFLRLTPNIDPHTHKKISTGTLDCKFGTPIVTGQAEELVRLALQKKNVLLYGLHCHVGSQIFEEESYYQSTEVMTEFIAYMYRKIGWLPQYLDLGGGFGIRYTEKDPVVEYGELIKKIGKYLNDLCMDRNIPVPALLLEPGRSIVGDCGITVYSVVSVKEIPHRTSYVAVDGGMTDNPRYALYGAEYTMLLANKAKKPADFKCTVAGRCCESGDLLGENILIQKPEKGDLLVVLSTGAYNYSMASNYNRVPRPAIVTVSNGKDKMVVRRESYEDLLAADIF